MERPDEEQRFEAGRRRFVAGVIAVIGTVMTILLGVPVLGFLLSPLFERPWRVRWSSLGPLSGFPDGIPTAIAFTRQVTGGPPQREGAYVIRKDRSAVVYSIHCTHLGCPYTWSQPAQQFFCPCHGGVFTKEGQVISGPPPRPLDRFETRVVQGVLYVRRLMREPSHV